MHAAVAPSPFGLFRAGTPEGRAALGLAVVLLLAAHAALAVDSLRRKSVTYDEVAHLPAGLALAATGEMRLNRQHPPLVKWLAGLAAGTAGPELPLDGEDWFDVNDEKTLAWKEIAATLERSQQRLSQAVSEVAGGARTSPLGEAERFDVVIGITGHAAYHAGQIQLLKKLID